MDKSTQSLENRRRSTATQDRTANPAAPSVQTHQPTGEPSGPSEKSGDRSSVKASTQAAGENANGADAGIVDRVRERAGAQLATQKDKACDGLGTVARAFRRTTQELREQQQDSLAEYIDGAADQLERLSSGLKKKNVGDLFHDVQQVARRQPVVFVGSAFALGLLSARFFKSSSPHRSHQSPEWQRMGRETDASFGSGYSQANRYGQPAPGNLRSTVPAANPAEVRSGASGPPSSASSRQAGRGPGAENG